MNSSLPLEQAKKYFSNLNTRELIGHKKKVHSVAWNSTGRKLASGSVDQTVRIWGIDSSSTTLSTKDSMPLTGHTESVDQLCWDPTNADRLASASLDKTVKIWDTRSGKCAANFNTPGENINLAFSPDGRYVAVGNKADVVCIIDVKASKIIKHFKFHVETNEICWNVEGNIFCVTTGTGTIELSSLPFETDRKRTIQAHQSGVFCIKFDPLGKLVPIYLCYNI